MPIVIEKVGSHYSARVSPPESDFGTWKTEEPLGVESLVQALLALGCHQTDIGDAFYSADPDWLGDQRDS